MKKLITIGMLLSFWICSGNLYAQGSKLIVGERAPDLKIREWAAGGAAASGIPQLVEFFHSTSPLSEERLETLGALAGKYRGRLAVVVIARESREKIALLLTNSHLFSVALDDNGKTFGAYQVQFVPFSVLIDGRGRVRWFGNSADLTDEIIQKNL